ncbi:hypothetical protein PO909_028740, partial [Leuciscus waleckii]
FVSFRSPTKGSPTNNVSPTSTPAKSAAAVPTLEPPRSEATPAAETATDSLLDLDPLSSSGPSAGGASAAPTSWGDLLGSEMGSLTSETLLPDPTLAVDSNSSATPTAAEAAVSLAPPPSAAGASSGSADLLGDVFAAPAAETAAAAEGGATAATPTSAADGTAATESAGAGEAKPATATTGGDLMSAFDGMGDMLMPAMAPQASGASPMTNSPVKPMGGNLDSAMANMASNLTMGNQKPGEAAGGANWQSQPGAGASPMMPGSPMMASQQQMMRPQFPAAGAPGQPMSPGMAQSPRKPPPSKDPLADLNIKDFM